MSLRVFPSIRALGFAVLPALVLASAVAAQDVPGIYVVIPDRYPDLDAPAVIVRDGTRDLVLLRDGDASVETLSTALAVLARARSSDPHPARGEMIPLVGLVRTKELRPDVSTRLRGILDRLVHGPVRDMGALGDGRWIRYERGR